MSVPLRNPLLDAVIFAVVAFASTNIDDAFVLAGSSNNAVRTRDVIVGHTWG